MDSSEWVVLAYDQIRAELLAKLHGRCPVCNKALLLHDRLMLDQTLTKCHAVCLAKGSDQHNA